MTQIGQILKSAREAQGLSVAQLAEKTNMSNRTIEDLENERFDNFAAPIYVRGFIKLYCRLTKIDPQPLLVEYNEILNGNRDPEIRERPSAGGESTADTPESAAETPEPAEITAPEPPPSAPPFTGRDGVPPPSADFRLESEVCRTPFPNTATDPEPAAPMADYPAESEKPHPRFARYATPLRDYASGLPSIPSAFWRFAIVGIIAAAILFAVGYGIRALYRATAAAPIEETATAVAEPEKPAEAKKPAAPKTQVPAKSTTRKGQKIPALFID